MTRVKICGVTQLDDAARASATGADFVGLNFWEKSKRRVALDRAAALAAAIRGAGAAKVVGVFVDADLAMVSTVLAAVELDILQLHGDEPPELVTAIAGAAQRPVWKALPIAAPADLDTLARWPVEALLLDTPTPGRGGSGVTFDWSIAREARRRYPARNFRLAGGLTPDNVARAIAEVQPWGVDVASGVEAAPGIKDAAKLAAFIAAARST
jgi:phosphoribosylanthranilate isomerase